MDAPVRVRTEAEAPIPDLVTRLIDETKAYARAEVDLYKAIAQHRTQKAKKGGIALAAGGILLWFAGIALVLGLVLGLATLIGPLAAGLAVTAVLGVVGFLLVRSGSKEMGALAGDEEEREALERGEKVR